MYIYCNNKIILYDTVAYISAEFSTGVFDYVDLENQVETNGGCQTWPGIDPHSG